MYNKLKVMTVVGTRPELIKMSRIIVELDKQFNHTLVHTGQNHAYELNQVFFDDLGIRTPNKFLNVVESNHLAKTTAAIIEKTDQAFEDYQPDAVVYYGDTNSCLGAIMAKRRHIPIFHLEAGNRCFDYRVPEEINRKIIDHISDINLVLSEHARRYLIAENLPPERIIKIGSCMQEIFSHHHDAIEASEVLSQMQLSSQAYFIVSAHREENVDDPKMLEQFVRSLNAIAEHYQMPVLVSTHPRTQHRLENLPFFQKVQAQHPAVKFQPAFGFLDYVKLLKNAYCVLSDSGSITEDASLLAIPAVTIREQHERPEGMDVGTLIMSGLSAQRIMHAIDMVVSQQREQLDIPAIVPDYQVEKTSTKVARIILSYTDYINQRVWQAHSAPTE